MAKKIGMIEILDNFYAKASPDAADLITKHAVKRNKEVQASTIRETLKRGRKVKQAELTPEEIAAGKAGF